MKKYFLTGLATLLPVAVTMYVVVFVVSFLTRPFMGMVTNLLQRSQIYPPAMIKVVAQILILISLFVFILLLGFIARWFFIKGLIKLGEAIMQRIPLINKVYKTTKEIIRILFSSDKNSFKQVVMVHFPDKESYCLGLISRESPELNAEQDYKEMVSVFIPTTPNPTTGFMIISPKSELIYLDMKSDEAVKYIVSCGVVQPGEQEEL